MAKPALPYSEVPGRYPLTALSPRGSSRVPFGPALSDQLFFFSIRPDLSAYISFLFMIGRPPPS